MTPLTTPCGSIQARDGLTFVSLLTAGIAIGSFGSTTVTAQALAPVARSAVVTTQEGVAKTGVLPATDPESDPLTFSVVTPPAEGRAARSPTRPPARSPTRRTPGRSATTRYVYRAADATGGSTRALGSVFIVTATPTWPGQTARASVANDGSQLATPSNMGAWPNADGRFIVFTSGRARRIHAHRAQRLRP